MVSPPNDQVISQRFVITTKRHGLSQEITGNAITSDWGVTDVGIRSGVLINTISEADMSYDAL
jgi:hypothetical protein